ncbi:MAG: DMT family transporter [Immundisolibacterales bacterium]|nr:DMT family transporter [Immundisolibacterales bacterium]
MHAFTARHRNLRGIAWLMLSLPCFQSMNVMLRHVAMDLPPVEAMFFRNLFGFIILLPLFVRRPEALRTRQLGMNVLRGAIHLGGMVAWVYALTLIPLATAAALVFSTPVFVAIGAVLFFGERPGPRRWIAIGLGLVGVLVIMRPGVEAVSLGALVVLGASALQGAAKMMVKVIVRTDSTLSAVFHLNVLMALFGLVPTIIFWRTPTLAHLGWFVVMAAVGAVAHYALTRAIEHADFTALQPFEFVQLGWAALLGFAFFAEIPGNHVLLGGAIIVAATSWMVHHEARRGRTSP